MKILVIEDDKATASYVATGLMQDGHVVDHIADGRDGLIQATVQAYDLMIVDRMLPSLDGLALVRTLRAAKVASPVLFLTALDGVDDRVEGLNAGADDYLVKPFSFAELSARVSALGRRPQLKAELTVLRVADLEIDLIGRVVARGGVRIDPQPREFKLLEHLMRTSGRVQTRTMLLEAVWDFHFDPQTNVVETHVSRLRAKVDRPFGRDLIHRPRRGLYAACRMRLPRIHSTALRLSLLIGALFLAATLAAVVAAYALSLNDLRERAKAGLLEEAAHLRAVFVAGGAPAAAEAIGEGAGTARSARSLVYFAGDKDSAAVGNAVPEAPFTGWRVLTDRDLVARDEPLDEQYIAFGTDLGGLFLMLGTSAVEMHETVEIFIQSLLLGLAASTLLAAAATITIMARTERRIAAIAGTLDAVAGGRYERRVPVQRGKSDDLARIANSINLMLDRLSSNIASLKHVSSDIAHDLKTPIQRLRATLEEACAAGNHAVQPAAVAEAIAQADVIVGRFQALLRIAQIEGGSPRSRFGPVDLCELCTALAEAYQPAVEDAGGALLLDVRSDGPILVSGDRDLLGQILANLVENAIRHAPLPTAIALRLEVSDGEAVILVEDDGPGIPDEERDKVFQRLYRLERSRTSEGSGLGLALVAAVVDLHDGRITLADNAPGLRVTVRLPNCASSRAGCSTLRAANRPSLEDGGRRARAALPEGG